jgi:hypothetical protein
MTALLLAAANAGQHDQAPPAPGSGLPIIIGVLAAVALVFAALYFLVVRGRMRPPGRVPERTTDTAARFERAQGGTSEQAQQATGEPAERHT